MVGALAAAGVPLAISASSASPVPPTVVIAASDGLNHFVVQVAGDSVAPATYDQDPILLRPSEPKADFLVRLHRIEQELPGQDLGSVYAAPDGTTRLHVMSSTPIRHEAQISAYRQALNTPADASVVQALAHTPGITRADWYLPGAVAVATSLSEAQVAALPGVKGVAVDGTSTASDTTTTPNDPYFYLQWGLDNTGQNANGVTGTAGDDVNALQAWTLSTGAGVKIGVVDSGAQSNHPDLAGVFSPASGNSLGETGFDPTAGATDSGHGTHVTGIIAAHANNGVGVAGIAPSATIVEEKASDSGSFWDNNIESGIYAALAGGAKIINLSLGSTHYDPTLEAAIQQAQVDGALVVCAAGNNAQNNDPTSPNPLDNTNPNSFYPATLPEPNIISVGASTSSDTMASFSNYGPNSVDVFAPGQNIASTWPGSTYWYMSGTSMATPMVSGIAALMWARNPTLTYAQIKSDIMNSVTKVPALASDAISGGVVNAYAAVQAASAPVALTFNGFNAITAGATSATSFDATGALSGVSSSTPLAWRISLGYKGASGTEAVASEPISVGSGASATTITTDGNGQAIYAPAGLTAGSLTSGTINVPLSADFPWGGTYALVASLVPASDPNGTAYTTQAVFFSAGGSGVTIQPPSGTSGTSGTSPSTTTPPSGTSGTSGTSPSTTTPPSGTSGTSGTSPSTTTPPSGTTPPPTSAVPTPGPTSTTPPPSAPTTPTSPTDPSTQPPPPSTVAPTPPPATPSPTPTSTTAPQTATTIPTPTTPGGPSGTSPSAPQGHFGLTSVSPTSGSVSGGNAVTIYGTAIPHNSGVLIGGVPAPVTTDNSPTSLDVVVGPHVAGTVSVEVIAPSGATDTLPNAFTFESNGGPSGTSPYTGTSGTTPTTTTSPTSPGTSPTTTTTPSSGTNPPPAGTSGTTPTTTTSPTSPGTSPTTTTTPSSGTNPPPAGTSGTTPTTAPNGATLRALPATGDLASIPSSMWSLNLADLSSVRGVSL